MPLNQDRANKVADECGECATAYEASPGLAGPGANAGTIADLYRTIARLARIIERQQNDLNHLMPDKSSDV